MGDEAAEAWGKGSDGNRLGSNRPMVLDEAERLATLALCCVAGVGAATINALKGAFGRLTDALKAPKEEAAEHFKSAEGHDAFLAIDDMGRWTEQCLAELDGSGATAVFPGDARWPGRLDSSGDYPILFAKGDLSALSAGFPAAAIVGSRDTDRCGQEVAAFWSRQLAAKGVVVVSGGALGVDAESHRGALAAGGKTVAVMGTGVDRSYPPENSALFKEIISSGGVLVSQFPLGMAPFRHNFILRNRLIAALSDAVLVARAGPGSGALSTAQEAHGMDKPVFAAPGDLTNPLAQGIAELVFRGVAHPLYHMADISQALGVDGPWACFEVGGIPIGPPPPPRARRATATPSGTSRHPRPTASAQPSGTVSQAIKRGAPPPVRDSRLVESLSPGPRRAFDALTSHPQSFDDLTILARLDAPTLADALLRLELQGLCQELPGRLYRRAVATGPPRPSD